MPRRPTFSTMASISTSFALGRRRAICIGNSECRRRATDREHRADRLRKGRTCCRSGKNDRCRAVPTCISSSLAKGTPTKRSRDSTKRSCECGREPSPRPRAFPRPPRRHCPTLNELTLLAHAARQEPLGRVFLEAAASGVAVVASDVGGTREIFPRKPRRRLFPPDDAAWLAAAMLELLGDSPDYGIAWGPPPPMRRSRQFDIRKSVGELIRHYEAL